MIDLEEDIEAFKAHLLWVMISNLPDALDHWDRRSLASFHMAVFGQEDFYKLIGDDTWPYTWPYE